MPVEQQFAAFVKILEFTLQCREKSPQRESEQQAAEQQDAGWPAEEWIRRFDGMRPSANRPADEALFIVNSVAHLI